VVRRTVAYLGKHANIDAARAYAAQLALDEDAHSATGGLETLRELTTEYWRHKREYSAREPELDGIKKTRDHLKDQSSKAAKDERKQLKGRLDQIEAHRRRREDARRRALEVLDALPREEREKALRERLPLRALLERGPR
jgi:hypothetical protein